MTALEADGDILIAVGEPVIEATPIPLAQTRSFVFVTTGESSSHRDGPDAIFEVGSLADLEGKGWIGTDGKPAEGPCGGGG
ncbi:MAG: hypothetical protein DI566_04360 [Microbacterium sp.]|nr:MAG: hypothetical protein DI566_04360 [Microbacterium sp.]